VQVQFRHMGQRRFDLVVGADGLHSDVRRLAFGAAGSRSASATWLQRSKSADTVRATRTYM
jgi:2-polyprenyl-6-methoxyphenol hydroxylase-like FAD-dependent oxidoreductase